MSLSQIISSYNIENNIEDFGINNVIQYVYNILILYNTYSL